MNRRRLGGRRPAEEDPADARGLELRLCRGRKARLRQPRRRPLRCGRGLRVRRQRLPWLLRLLLLRLRLLLQLRLLLLWLLLRRLLLRRLLLLVLLPEDLMLLGRELHGLLLQLRLSRVRRRLLRRLLLLSLVQGVDYCLLPRDALRDFEALRLLALLQ